MNVANYGCDMFNQSCQAGVDYDDPDMRSNWSCSSCTARGSIEFEKSGQVLKERCPISTYPDICVPDEAAGPKRYWAVQRIEEDPKGFTRAATYVGRRSEHFKYLAQAKGGGLTDPMNLAFLQCKFGRDNWVAWIKAIRELYKAWLANYSDDGTSIKMQWDTDSSSVLGCNPWIYLENEVNLYFRPPKSPPDPHNLQQDEDLRNAIVGFFYVGQTCLQMLSDLEGVSCRVPWTREVRTTAHDRCSAYACGNISDGERKQCVKTFVDDEHTLISVRKDIAYQLCNAFNAAYRSDGREKVSVFVYSGSTSIYYKQSLLKDIVQGRGVSGANVFKAVPPSGENEMLDLANLAEAPSRSNTWRSLQANVVHSATK